MRSTLTRRDTSRRRTPRRALVSATLALALTAPVALASTTAAAAPTADPDRAAVGYLIDQLDAETSPGNVADVVLAAAAAGSGADAVAAAFADLGDVTGLPPGRAAKVLLAASALGDTATAADVEASLRAAVDGSTGQVGDTVQLFTQALAVLALETTADGAPAEAVTFLADQACDDGGYVFQGTSGCTNGSDTDVTAIAAQALLVADADAGDQIDWLLANQDAATGSFPSSGVLNSNSTALAAQALRAAGEQEAAGAAAAFVATQFEDCDADAAVRGSYRFTEAGAGHRFIATSQAVFATAPTLDALTLEGATAATERLSCSTTFCPPDTGISVAVDFTTLDPAAGVDVRCARAALLPAEPSGLDVLRAAGFEIDTEDFSFGTALCAIEGLPELGEDDGCFDGGGFYGYSNAPQGGDWATYNVGAADGRPQVGTIEGFAWSGGTPRVSTTPAGFAQPPLPFDRGVAAVCPDEYPLNFGDVAEDSVHALTIACLASTPIIQGTSDTTFSPSRNVTRDQVASILVRAIERATGQTLPTGDGQFTDTAGNVHADAIDKLANADVVRGTSANRFSPREPLSRQQMATVLANTLDLLDNGAVDGSYPPAATSTGVFSDVEAGNVHASAIDRLADQGVVAGRADGTFGPAVDVRRDQIASFVARALDVAVVRGLAPPIAGD